MYPGDFNIPTRNVGPVERFLRFVLTGLLVWFSITLTLWWAILAVYICFTAVAAWCPFKDVIGIKHKLF